MPRGKHSEDVISLRIMLAIWLAAVIAVSCDSGSSSSDAGTDICSQAKVGDDCGTPDNIARCFPMGDASSDLHCVPYSTYCDAPEVYASPIALECFHPGGDICSSVGDPCLQKINGHAGTCYLYGEEEGAFYCMPTGDVPVGKACTSMNDCVPGSQCLERDQKRTCFSTCFESMGCNDGSCTDTGFGISICI